MNKDDIPLKYRDHPRVLDAFDRIMRDKHRSRVEAADRAACKFWCGLLGVFAWNLYDAGQQAWRKDVPRP